MTKHSQMCGLAREYRVSVTDYVDGYTAFAGKPAPTECHFDPVIV